MPAALAGDWANALPFAGEGITGEVTWGEMGRVGD